MNISDYIEKLKSKPERHREKIAVIATGVTFFLIFLIWMVSFSETNKMPDEAQSSTVSDSLEDLRSGIKEDKQSIQEMMEDLPADTATENLSGVVPNESRQNISAERPSANESENQPVMQQLP